MQSSKAAGYNRGRGSDRIGYGTLVLQLARKDFKIRYTHSMLGYAWSVINPFIFFLLYFIVFSLFLRFDIENYPAFLLVGVVIWNFFNDGTSRGVAALLTQADLLSKMYFPRDALVHAALLSAGLTFAVNLTVLVIFLWATGATPGASVVCFPLLLIDLIALTLGVSLLLSPLYVRYRDIGYLWSIGLQVGFWITPIFYSELMVPEEWRWIVWSNPVARVIGDCRRVLLHGLWPGARGLLITTAYSVGVLLAGSYVFRRLQARVVEYL